MNGIKRITDTRIWSLVNKNENTNAPYDADKHESKTFSLQNNGEDLVMTKEKYFETNQEVTESLVNVVMDAITNKTEPEQVINCTNYSNYDKYGQNRCNYNPMRNYSDYDDASTLTASTTPGMKKLQKDTSTLNLDETDEYCTDKKLAPKQMDNGTQVDNLKSGRSCKSRAMPPRNSFDSDLSNNSILTSKTNQFKEIQNDTCVEKSCGCKCSSHNDHHMEMLTRQSIQNIKLELQYLEEILANSRDCMCKR
jgi:hypothetical protein